MAPNLTSESLDDPGFEARYYQIKGERGRPTVYRGVSLSSTDPNLTMLLYPDLRAQALLNEKTGEVRIFLTSKLKRVDRP